ncbi:tRNA-dihydrouridine(20a/20b) synthase [NAD(P)+]-like isoform X2 [Venturia canescens]|uniref:tRNA-dihydrouridine(20a/20b) synthase [NAD(P)+]-like isoform X2 n=1 Tax=Venturia canescens TaxID=32260 RepID=UPI001C9CA904|nr:tRNA-dihydrouridine(20a/20b) synthase [NAD(P)+]-like isoform X2 [Venturia canescens]
MVVNTGQNDCRHRTITPRTKNDKSLRSHGSLQLPFRALVRRYNCDICFTPMILADSFVQSARARDNEFVTNKGDTPLIVQFAANNPDDFVNAAQMVYPYCNGVDLNCGCPQRWAMKSGYGCDLLTKPQLVKDMVMQVRNRIPGSFTVSVKIRLLDNIRETINLSSVLEKAGVSFITVHARTQQMRKEAIDLKGLKSIRDSLDIPIIANGDVKTLDDAEKLYKNSNCDGVMTANGILSNPGLFAGYSSTPLCCVQDWLDITSTIPTSFLCMHHHLVFMLEKVLSKKDKYIFNNLQNREAVLLFLDDFYGLKPSNVLYNEMLEPIPCHYTSYYRTKIVEMERRDMSDDYLENLFSEI